MFSALVSRPGTFTFSFVLKACERVKVKSKCRLVHGNIIRCAYERDIVCTNVVRSYVVNGLIGLAQMMFANMPERDLVSWNSMISCYFQAGFHHEASKVYDRTKNENVGLDGFMLVGLFSSCAHVGALNIEGHRVASEEGFVENVIVGNALIDMHAKCGSLDDALRVIDCIQRRDIFT
jgi:pentatricopeptide repeat protein